MKKHINLSSYDEVEELENFTEESFQKYCLEKLQGISKHIAYIKKNCINNNWNGRVCEIGSGNSKLLYGLEKGGLLEEGVGIEISKSRYRFAEKFKKYINSKKIYNLNKNILDINPFTNLDLIIGVDIVLQLISPLYKNAESDIVDWIRKSLKSGGSVLLELWDFKHILEQLDFVSGNLQIWEEFSINDPYEFMLARINKDENEDIIWEKTFIKRNSCEKSSFTNILRPYSPEQITSILKKHGFQAVECFYQWNKPGDVSQGEYIVLAKKV